MQSCDVLKLLRRKKIYHPIWICILTQHCGLAIYFVTELWGLTWWWSVQLNIVFQESMTEKTKDPKMLLLYCTLCQMILIRVVWEVNFNPVKCISWHSLNPIQTKPNQNFVTKYTICIVIETKGYSLFDLLQMLEQLALQIRIVFL